MSLERASVLHVVAGCWANGGGLSEAVVRLVHMQAKQGAHVVLVFLEASMEHPMVAQCREMGVQVKTFRWPLRNPLFFSPGLLLALPRLIRGADRVYIHGCWTFPVWWAADCARRVRIPYLHAPHGSLNPIQRAYGRCRKAVAWHLFDRRVMAGAALLHATSELEAQWLRDALRAACPPIRIVPLGVDGDVLDAVPPQRRTQTFLYLGRLHPLKGLDLLIEAWKKASLGPAWELHIVGIADGVTLPPTPGVRVLPPLYGKEKAMALRSAGCLILPTRSENFGLVVAEALWCRTPVICTKGAPWPELGTFWVDVSSDALANAIQRMAALTEKAREAHFAPVFEEARKRFSWEACATALAKEWPLKPHAFTLRDRVFFNLPSLWAWMLHPLARSPRVMDSEETLQKVLAEKCSVARFGDGDFRIMRGGGEGYQRPDPTLRRRLISIARVPTSECLVCLPDFFRGLHRFTPKAAATLRRILLLQRPWIAKTFGHTRLYGDAYISRFYLDTLDPAKAERILALWRKVWDGRDLLIVEGCHSRFGVGNDLLSNARSIRRILCPARDAWSAYDAILAAALRHAPGRLTLIALGPTATVLAHDLSRAGHQAIDCGHLDVEYGWLRMGATEKVPLPERWVDEAGGLSAGAQNPTLPTEVVEDISL